MSWRHLVAALLLTLVVTARCDQSYFEEDGSSVRAGIQSLLGSGFLHSLIPEWSNLLRQLNPHLVDDMDPIVWPERGQVIDDDAVSHVRAIRNGDFVPRENRLDPMTILTALVTPILGVSEQCLNDSVRYIEGLNKAEQWALMMFDANGKLPSGIMSTVLDGCDLQKATSDSLCGEQPYDFVKKMIKLPHGNTASVGAVDECITATEDKSVAPFSSRYVYMKLNPSKFTGKAFEEITFSDGRAPQKLPSEELIQKAAAGSLAGLSTILVSVSEFFYGQCVPASCNTTDVFINNLVVLWNLTLQTDIYNTITEEDTNGRELSNKTIGFIAVLSVLAGLMLLGTLIETWQEANPYRDLLPKKEPGAPEYLIVRVLKCFSIYGNGKRILNTDPPKDNANHLGCLGGIRVISMAWVILGHTYLQTVFIPVQNPDFRDKFLSGQFGFAAEVLLNALPSVDTFFFLSGTLVAYLSFIQLEKKAFNLVVFYVHRYVRLTIPYAFMIGFAATIIPHLSWGLNWMQIDIVESFCEKNGWINVVYLNNFINQTETCMGVTWYMANDMQFYILSPLFILPLWKSFWLGLLWWSAVMVGMTCVLGWFVIHYQLSPTQMFAFIQNPANRFLDMDHEFYMRPYIRFQPYMIGLLFGYALYKTRGKAIKIPHVVNLVLWQASLLAMIAVVFGIGDLRSHSTYFIPGYTLVESVFYNCFHKIAWSLALAWIVFSCVHGYGGVINSFLSWGLFTSLARLSYMAYLIHYEVLMIFYFSADYVMELSHLVVIQVFIGALIITFAASFVASLAFEAPFLGLEKIVMGGLMAPKRRPRAQPTPAPPGPQKPTEAPSAPSKQADDSPAPKLEEPAEEISQAEPEKTKE